MSIEFRCEKCNILLRMGDDTAGQMAQCPQCGAQMRVPPPETADVPLSEPPASASPRVDYPGIFLSPLKRFALPTLVLIIIAVLGLIFGVLHQQRNKVYTGPPEEAIKYYRQALSRNPDDFEAHNNLGYALFQVGRLPEAIEHYMQALRLKPDYAESHNNLGLALSQAGRVQEAIEHFRQALRLKPDYAESHNNLGLTLSQTGRVQEAIEHFRQALRLKPDYPEAHNNLGVALSQTGRAQEAIKQFQQASRLKPDYAEAYYNLALACAKTNQRTEAIAAAQKALEIAKSKGQTALAKNIDDWLNSYRASRSGSP